MLSWRQSNDQAGPKIRLQARSWRSASSALLPVATAALAAGVFIAEAITPMKLAVAVFYVVVVLLAARFCSARGIVLVGAGCAGLTLLAFFLPGFSETEAGGTGVKASIGVAVIGLATFLVTERKRAMETLRESEEQWKEVFEHNPVMYFMVSPTGIVMSVNAAGAIQLGYTADELIGQSVLNVFFEEDRDIVKGHVATCLGDLGRSHTWEIRKIRKDGAVIWVRENAKAVRRSGNDVIVLIACEDITERRRAEQRRNALYAVTGVLAEADNLAAAAPRLLRAIGENLEWDWGALWSFEQGGDREGATLRCDRVWHAPHIEAAEFAEFDMIRQERAFAAGEGRLGQVWRSGVPAWMVDATTEPGFLRASDAARAGLHGGVIFPVLLDTDALGVAEFFSRAPQERDEEQLATLSAIGSQIGQFIKRRRAEAALRTSEERWRKLFEISSVGMGLFRLDGLCTAANSALQRMLGRAEEEIVGHNVLELNHEDERAVTADALAQYRSGSLTERRAEKKYLKKDGSPIWLDITNTLVPATETAAPFLQAVYVDLTERVQFEAALRASEERWRAMVETAPVGIMTFDSEHHGYLTANKSFQLMTGYTEDELRNLKPLDITHEDDRAATRALIDDIAAGPNRSYRIEKRYRRRNGEIVWADVDTFFVPTTDSTPAFFGVMAIDITDRKRAEAALRASEERWRAMFETAPVGIATLDFELRSYLTANESFQRMTGYTEDELRHLTTLNITHEDDRAAMQKRIDDGTIGVLQRKRYRRKDGGVVWADATSFVVPATDSTPAFRGAVIVDITDRQRTEEALQQAQADLARLNRVMVLEEMAASVAHEVNQPIAAVITNANAGLRWLGAQQPDLQEVRQALGRIVRDGTRAGEVISRIRALVKKTPPRRERLDINQTIREVVALTQTEMQRNGVTLQSRLANDLPLVPADRVQLQQIMINLIINAIEAMAGTGDGSRELAIVSRIDDANDVVVEVRDTGPGLDPEKLDRLFQSFYTTKPDGIGMGLAISRSIAEANGGCLSAAPNNPRGAVFRFTLPVEDVPKVYPAYTQV
jgi:PAS domain S-box-containing protein